MSVEKTNSNKPTQKGPPQHHNRDDIQQTKWNEWNDAAEQLISQDLSALLHKDTVIFRKYALHVVIAP